MRVGKTKVTLRTALGPLAFIREILDHTRPGSTVPKPPLRDLSPLAPPKSPGPPVGPPSGSSHDGPSQPAAPPLPSVSSYRTRRETLECAREGLVVDVSVGCLARRTHRVDDTVRRRDGLRRRAVPEGVGVEGFGGNREVSTFLCTIRRPIGLT